MTEYKYMINSLWRGADEEEKKKKEEEEKDEEEEEKFLARPGRKQATVN
jgi:hypothetical protein